MAASARLSAGQEEEGKREDQVHGKELRALEPVRTSVACNLAHYQHRQEDGENQARGESQIHWTGTERETRQYQDRRHKERHLHARADRDRERKVHAVLHCRTNRRRVLGRISQ